MLVKSVIARHEATELASSTELISVIGRHVEMWHAAPLTYILTPNNQINGRIRGN